MTSKSLGVVSVEFNVELMLLAHLLHHLVNVWHATGSSSHGSSREVGMATSTIPVSEELGLKSDRHTKIFSDSAQEISRNPEHISGFNTFAGSDLIFPLARHDLAVSTGDLNTRVEASFVMSIHDGSTIAVVGSY